LTKGADKSWVVLRCSSYCTTNVTALVPAASWSYYRALSVRMCTENLTYMSNPMGLFPPSSPSPWMLYTQQGYEYVFVKVVTVIMYHRFQRGCLCVCKLQHTHRWKSVLFSTNVGSCFSLSAT